MSKTLKQVWRGQGAKYDDPAFRLQQYVSKNGDLARLKSTDLQKIFYTITGPDGVESVPTDLTPTVVVLNDWVMGNDWPASQPPGYNVEIPLTHDKFVKPAGYENKTVTFTVSVVFVLAGTGRQWAEDFSYQVY